MSRLLIWLLKKFATKEVMAWIVSTVAEISYTAAMDILDATIDKVAEVERKLGASPGEEKARVVKNWLRDKFGLKETKWLVNLILELAVAYAKRKGLIK